MLKLIVMTRCSTGYVADTNLEYELQKCYPGQSEDIIKQVHRMMLGNTRVEMGIYPHDLAAIFHKLNIDVAFENEAGELLNVSSKSSGISLP